MTAAIDTHALVQLAWAAPLAVLAVTVAWGVVVVGATRAAEARRDRRHAAAAVNAGAAIAAGALFIAAIVAGLIIMTTK